MDKYDALLQEYNLRKILKNIIMTIDFVTSRYVTYRETDKDGIIQEFITTIEGPGHCVSVAGLDTTKLTVKSEPGFGTIMPLMAIRERIPAPDLTIREGNETDNDGEEDDINQNSELDTTESSLNRNRRATTLNINDLKHTLTIYKTNHGQWATNVQEVILASGLREMLPVTIKNLHHTKASGIYFLVKKYSGEFEWIWSEQEYKVRCPTARGLHFIRNKLNSISAQLFRLIEFFDSAQSPPPKNDTSLDPSYYLCRPSFRNLPRVVNLAINDAIVHMKLNKVKCEARLNKLFDAAERLTQKRPYTSKDFNNKIKPHSKNKRSVWDLFGPSFDYTPVYETLRDLRDNLYHNHIKLQHHHQRMRSLETLAQDETTHIRLLGTLHNLDTYSRDLDKHSLSIIDSLKYANNIMQEVLSNLQNEAILLANSIHYDASCFSHRHRHVSCAKDVPRVNFTSDGILTIEYYSESIALENREYYTCLPTKYGLSFKHHHYAIQVSGGTILLNNGKLITNATDPESFYDNYSQNIASIDQCFFNTRQVQDPHIYLNCKIETDVHFRNSQGRIEVVTLKPFQLQRINFDQFPVTIGTNTLELRDVVEKQSTALYDNLYASVAREAWYSALHLPRALLEHKNRIKQSEYWADVAKLAIKYPKVRYYFTISVIVMSFTALGLIAGCVIKYRVNLFNCFVAMYACCRPKSLEELRKSPIIRRGLARGRRESPSPDSSGVETSVKDRVKTLELETRAARSQEARREGARARSRARSRSSRRRTRSRSRSRSRSRELPSYNEASSALLRDNSTQVRDKYASRARR